MKIIIEGAGEVGSHLAKMLSHEANDITVIDTDAERLTKLSAAADVITIQGDPSSVDVLKKAGAASADLLIAVNPFVPQSINLVSSLLAKKLGTKRVTARIDDESYLAVENKLMFKDMGVDLMFYPEKIACDETIELLKHSSTS
ncbi:MAG: NAD-binding protein, partial [Bacteroidales bacterium]|nr:NAD-binding protein [Bacteroidales bacterium]